jgi:hypothetical protein
MKAVKFHTIVGQDQIIRLPEGVLVTPGAVEVIVLQPDGAPRSSEPNQRGPTATLPLAQRLARIAEELGIQGLPSDLAENHDHYVHGTSKGIDEA